MYSTFWRCATLIAAIFVLRHVFGELSHEKIKDYSLDCPFNQNAYHSSNHLKHLRNCEAEINMGKVHLKCEAYASSSMDLTQFTNATAGMLVIDFMETYEDIHDILTGSSNFSCLKFTATRFVKKNFVDSEIAKKYNEYTCKVPKETFIPFMLIQLMDMTVIFTDEYALGFAKFNKTCLKIASDTIQGGADNTSVDVSSCLTTVQVVLRFLPSANNFRTITAGITMEDLFSKDFLSIILVLTRELFFFGYTYWIQSITFKTGLFKYLPTKALTFLSQKNVTTVDFQGNCIHSIRNGDIPTMASLVTLDLSHCLIESIEQNAFDGVANLQQLHLQGNKLKELSDAFSVLTNVQILNVAGNGGSNESLFQYRNIFVNKKSNLRELDLSNMVLMNFWANLGSLPKLEQLNLANCTLIHVPDTNISDFFPNLTYLNLSHNNIRDLSVFALSGLNKLQYLDLSWNLLTDIRYNSVIDAIPKLKVISLKANRISHFSTLTLNSNSALESLDLSLNKINPWNEATVNSTDIFGLKLNLVGNNITEVNSHMLKDFSAFQHVQLDGNPFDCKSCLLKDFIAWLNIANNSTDFPTAPYSCFFPKEDFKKTITNVTLELCLEGVFDWLLNVVIPVTVVAVLVTIISVTIIVYRWHLTYFVYLIRSKVQKRLRRHNGVVFKYDAFVSYSTEDRDWVVNHLIPEVEKQDPRLHLCIHERDFEAGETIMNNIIECIDSSHKSIFVVSQKFIQSQWCQWELQMAQHKLFEDKRDVLILIMLGGIDEKKTPKMLKHLISKRTYLQWTENRTGQRYFWTRLRNAIGECQCIELGILREKC